MTTITTQAPDTAGAPRRPGWLRRNLAVILAAVALVLSGVSLAQAGHPGPQGPQGAQGVAGAAGPQGPQGPRGHRGPAGTDGAAAPGGPATGGSGSEPALAPAGDQKQQACIDTYTGTLTPAQINEYCAPGGLLYGG